MTEVFTRPTPRQTWQQGYNDGKTDGRSYARQPGVDAAERARTATQLQWLLDGGTGPLNEGDEGYWTGFQDVMVGWIDGKGSY